MYTAEQEWWIDGTVSRAVQAGDPEAVYPLLKAGETLSDELAERYGLTAEPPAVVKESLTTQPDENPARIVKARAKRTK